MFNRREIEEHLDELKVKVLPSIKDWAETLLKTWNKNKHFNSNSPLLIEVVGVQYTESRWGEPAEAQRFEKPYLIPAVGSVLDRVIGIVSEGEDVCGYVLKYSQTNLYKRVNDGDHPHYYEFDDKTNALIQAVRDYENKAYEDKRKVEKLLEYYTGKDINRIKAKDEFLYNIVCKVIGYTGGDGMPKPDNLADIVNSSETITVPELKVLTCSAPGVVVEVVED
jgi:hypothetical protein